MSVRHVPKVWYLKQKKGAVINMSGVGNVLLRPDVCGYLTELGPPQ